MKIIVIGAGVAGLAAAQNLTKNGHEVVVLEAQNRVGGRVWTDHDFANFPIEFGAEFVHGNKAVSWQFIGSPTDHSINIGLQKTWQYQYRGRLRHYSELVHDPVFSQVFPIEAGTHPAMQNVAKDISVAAWVDSLNLEPEAAWWAKRLVSGIYLAEPESISMAELSHEENVHHAGKGNFHLREGYDVLLKNLSQGLNILLEYVVTDITWEKGKIRVHVAGQDALKAEKAIITLPLSLLQQNTVTFTSALPPEKQQSIQALAMGSALKIILAFKETFWDENVPLFLGSGDILAWWPCNYKREGGKPVLTAFLASKAAEKYSSLTETEIFESCLVDLSRMFGNEKPRQLFEKGKIVDWNKDPFSRGGYSYVPAGSFGARKALAEPVAETLYFAGEATAYDTNPATVHGAIESGQRAAREILEM